ncbi:MAG: urea transporter [Salinivirgaceae bacterium]|nr:urea transporter [Salinivirgaceae bacterium]
MTNTEIRNKIKVGKPFLDDFLQIVLNSYSQIFFSTHRYFASLILLVTFFDFYTGLFGLISVLTMAIAGLLLGFNRSVLKKGLLGFNSLLVGLGLGVYFSPSLYLAGIVILAALFTFFISVSLQGVIGKYGLPFLSVPFILSLWAFMLATSSFHAMGLNERGIYTLNELYVIGGQPLITAYEFINNLEIWDAARSYFISLSAILFQYNVLTGFVLAFGLLLFSRIAFSLSVIGFFIAYGFYHIIGAEITNYDYSFFGFNYILSSIALGGFFLIPSRTSYLWMILLIPFVAILTISLNIVFMQFRLPIYSLPFNLVVLLFLYSLKFRERYSYKLSEVYFQHNAPEKNLYIFLNNKERFRFKSLIPIKLPFYGTWKVSQAHNGEYTHKGVFKHAWDFIIENYEGKQFKNDGDLPDDYFCYNKPLIAPENGIIEQVIDGIEDNIIGQANLIDNWGNTIIIKHNNEVYSKLSHLKKGTIKVKKGDEVKFGQIIANCGNSGRSPFPHVHFQIQPYPFNGSATIDYPLSNYMVHDDGNFSLKTHTKPENNQLVSNIETTDLLVSALNFIPGQILNFNITDGVNQQQIEWEVQVNEYNQSYMYCSKTEAKAYFENDDNLFYFTYYEGNKKSSLFYLFQALYKVQKGFYKQLEIIDQFPLYLTFPKYILWLYDFISPFVSFSKSQFSLNYFALNDTISPTEITLKSSMTNFIYKKKLNCNEFITQIDSSGIAKIDVFVKKQHIIIEQ